LLNSSPSHPAFGQGVRRLQRWCRKFALLPTSFKPISRLAIELESEQPIYRTAFSEVYKGVHEGMRVTVKVARTYGNSDDFLAGFQKVICFSD
jgi:hypothetical protein